MGEILAGRPTLVNFLWLELTNRCNLACVHCYADSHPRSGYRDALSTADYVRVMTEAAELGCRQIQFIGGEPQLNADFDQLLAVAGGTGFEFVEVFSNLTSLRPSTLEYAVIHDVRFATSVYSDDPAVHDRITRTRGSHSRTIRNLERLIEAGVDTRAATSRSTRTATRSTRPSGLEKLGVGHARIGRIREFGRAEEVLAQDARLDGLCGHCWSGKLCVAPDGAVYPCVMAREWPVGNLLDADLADIVHGRRLAGMRQQIYTEVWLPATSPPVIQAAGELPSRGVPGNAVRPRALPAKLPAGRDLHPEIFFPTDP